MLQAADAQRQAAAAAFAAAEPDYLAADADATAAAEARRRCAVVQEKLDDFQHWIDAQCEFHLRNAGSATCFIFMLVGIPLGILARRGSFIIALAISFCIVLFIHYPLVMIGETLATDGYLAPWIAEWMGNAAVGCIGPRAAHLGRQAVRAAASFRPGDYGSWFNLPARPHPFGTAGRGRGRRRGRLRFTSK